MISVISVINKLSVYNKNLKVSLERQENCDYEIVIVDNEGDKYNNMVEALMAGLKNATGDIILISHPDIYFNDRHILKKIEHYSIKIKNYGMLGIAGCSVGEKCLIYSNSIHGAKKKSIGVNIISPTLVQSVDECFFVVKKEVLNRYKFSEYLNTFHLYAVDECLKLSREDLKTYVLPIEVWHKSSGNSLNHTYYIQFIKLLRNYPQIDRINTTVMQANNTYSTILKLYYYAIRNYIHHKIKKDDGK